MVPECIVFSYFVKNFFSLSIFSKVLDLKIENKFNNSSKSKAYFKKKKILKM